MSQQPKTAHSAHSKASRLTLRPAGRSSECRTKYRYDPYGNIISQSGSLADANVYRFSSKEYHAATGFYYYGYRFYAPSLQRWLNRDPLEELGGLNLYGFAANNPVDNVDTDGKQTNTTTTMTNSSQVTHNKQDIVIFEYPPIVVGPPPPLDRNEFNTNSAPTNTVPVIPMSKIPFNVGTENRPPPVVSRPRTTRTR